MIKIMGITPAHVAGAAICAFSGKSTLLGLGVLGLASFSNMQKHKYMEVISGYAAPAVLPTALKVGATSTFVGFMLIKENQKSCLELNPSEEGKSDCILAGNALCILDLFVYPLSAYFTGVAGSAALQGTMGYFYDYMHSTVNHVGPIAYTGEEADALYAWPFNMFGV